MFEEPDIVPIANEISLHNLFWKKKIQKDTTIAMPLIAAV